MDRGRESGVKFIHLTSRLLKSQFLTYFPILRYLVSPEIGVHVIQGSAHREVSETDPHLSVRAVEK